MNMINFKRKVQEWLERLFNFLKLIEKEMKKKK